MSATPIGVLLYTYNRVDDARINMEIIRSVWPNHEVLRNVAIVHAYNGKDEWYPEKYLEDELVRIENTSHFQGASELMDAGMAVFQEKFPEVDYVIVLAADTWLVRPNYVASIIRTMQQEHKLLATSAWGLPERNEPYDVGVSLDFVVFNAPWAARYGLFPIRYKEFYDKYAELLRYYRGSNVMLEKLFLARFMDAVFRETDQIAGIKGVVNERIMRLTEREPVHDLVDGYLWHRRHYWPNMGLLTHHEPEPKRELLKELNVVAGPELEKFMTADDLSYFNRGLL